MCAKLLQSCPTLFDLMDSSPPDSFVCEILQVRILEWIALPSIMGSSHSGTEPESLMSKSCRRLVLYSPRLPILFLSH